MKFLITLFTLFSITAANAQCCPYINSVEVIPAAPTTLDDIKIVTTVTTAYQGNLIWNGHTVSNDTIRITACYYSGILAATQTYIDTISVGQLAPDLYTIEFIANESSWQMECNYSDSNADTSQFVVNGGINSVEPLNALGGSVYPNPTSGDIFFELPSGLDVTSVDIVDLSGKVIISDAYQSHMGLSLNTGVYFIRLRNREEIVSMDRLMVQ